MTRPRIRLPLPTHDDRRTTGQLASVILMRPRTILRYLNSGAMQGHWNGNRWLSRAQLRTRGCRVSTSRPSDGSVGTESCRSVLLVGRDVLGVDLHTPMNLALVVGDHVDVVAI